jgi:TatD DNase family protein
VSGWFDSHCHVQEEYRGGAEKRNGDQADGDEANGDTDLTSLLERATVAGVDRLVCIGTDTSTSSQAVTLARHVKAGDGALHAWASVGLHPHEATAGVEGVAALLEREIAFGDGVVVAVGECGLDYYYEHSPRHAQRTAFAAQIALAQTHNLALVIHARDAWDDVFDVLAAEGVPERTILHCFTGGPDELDRCVRAGMFVSFSGIITFKNASDIRDAAARCPFDRLLVETDSPFLAPVPHRGRPNEPSLLPLVGATVASVKGCAVEEITESTAAAAAAAFAIPL